MLLDVKFTRPIITSTAPITPKIIFVEVFIEGIKEITSRRC